MKKDLVDKIKAIRLVIFDLEGVLLNQSEVNEESIDHLINSINNAIYEYQKQNLTIAIITARHYDDLISRLEEIKNCIIVYSSLDKVSAAEKILKEQNLSCNNIFFIGDGILDIPLIKKCGLSASPKTAKREVKREVDIILRSTKCEEIFKEVLNLFQQVNQ